VYLQDDVMQVEYLQEYESTLLNSNEQDKILIQKNQIRIDTSTSHSDSNNCDMLLLQKRKAVINNVSSNEKENINEVRNNDVGNQSSSKVDKAFQDTLNRTKLQLSCEQNKTPIQKKKITKKELQNTVEVSTKLNNIYEQTYELKRNYYEARLEYLRRSVEAQEEMANSVKKCNENLTNISERCNMV